MKIPNIGKHSGSTGILERETIGKIVKITSDKTSHCLVDLLIIFEVRKLPIKFNY